MITYLLKSGLCLALLLAFYHLFLEREKMHQFNRFYLLGSVLFSFVAPSIIIYVEATQQVAIPVTYTKSAVVSDIGFFEQYFTIQNIALFIYAVVSSLLLIRFSKNLYHIIYKIRTNEVVRSDFAKFVPVDDDILPHTFWNYIFINKEEYKKGEIEQELFTHELAHVTQRHTIDVLIIELLQIFFWFNPLFFVLKKAVQLNHEFLADDTVIAAHHNIAQYQSLLLNKAAWKNEYYLASNLNYSLTKKRLLMMKTPNSRAHILIKKLALIPILAGLVFLFADRVEAQTKKKKPQVVEIVVKKATDAQMKEYKTLMNTAVRKKTFRKKDFKRLEYLYSIMSKQQRSTVKNVKDVIPPPPPPEKVSLNQVKKKDGTIPKPVKIEVIDKVNKGKKPVASKVPPKPVKIEVIKKEGKPKKIIVEELPPKPAKVKKQKKGKKPILIKEVPPPPRKKKKAKVRESEQGELIEVIEEEPETITEIIEILESPESPEVEEIVETPEVEEIREEAPEIEEIQEIQESKEIADLFDIELLNSYNSKGQRKAQYYYKGKKVSFKKAAKLLARHIKERQRKVKVHTKRDKKGNTEIHIID